MLTVSIFNHIVHLKTCDFAASMRSVPSLCYMGRICVALQISSVSCPVHTLSSPVVVPGLNGSRICTKGIQIQ